MQLPGLLPINCIAVIFFIHFRDKKTTSGCFNWVIIITSNILVDLLSPHTLLKRQD